MKVIDCEQGTEEWFAARAGKVTASRIVDVMAKIKTGEAKSRYDYKMELVAEILTGKAADPGYCSKEMQYGIDNEPFARAVYEVRSKVFVNQVGLVLHPRIERAAASPDGIIEPDGLIEIKCPKQSTHLSYILDGGVPSQYQPQMLWQMACTGAKWCDFVSYRHDLPKENQIFVVRFHRDEDRIKQIETEVEIFLAEVDAIVKKLQGE